jgi:hypothetical protein
MDFKIGERIKSILNIISCWVYIVPFCNIRPTGRVFARRVLFVRAAQKLNVVVA